jgi:flagellar biosynthesis protein FlhB
MSEDDDTEKEHEPSQKRLDDARQKGEFARSQDLLSAAAVAGFVLVSFGIGADALVRSGEAAMIMIDQSDRIAAMMTAGGRPVLMQALSAVISFCDERHRFRTRETYAEAIQDLAHFDSKAEVWLGRAV